MSRKTKVCPRCEQELDVSHFGGGKRLASYCSPCFVEYRKEDKERDPQKYKKYDDRRKGRAKKEVKRAFESNEKKACVKCSRVLPLSSFYVWNRGKNGRHPSCKKCVSQYAKSRATKNREKSRLAAELRRERLRNAPGGDFDPTRADYQARFELFGFRCYYCQGSFEAIDHLKPITRGGTNHPKNIVPSCEFDNKSKLDRTVAEWRKWLKTFRPDHPFLRKP